MILLSNHLLTLPEFKDIEDVIVRINMAHVKDIRELYRFVKIDYDIYKFKKFRIYIRKQVGNVKIYNMNVNYKIL